MKKLLFLLVSMFTIMLLLAGCGTKEEKTAETPKPTEEVKKEEPKPVEEPKTRKYKQATGEEIDVPNRPERVIALNNIGEMLALGVKPIGVSEYYLDKYDPEQMKGVENIGAAEPNLEKITELNPDLIVVSSYVAPETIANLKKIAPTAITTWGKTAFEQLTDVANLLNKKDEETAFVKKYEEKVAQTKEKVKPFMKEGETALVMQFFQKDIYIFPITTWEPIYKGLGFVVPEKSNVDKPTALSEEVLADYKADRIFVQVSDPTAEGVLKGLQSRPVWRNLPAVKNNHVYTISSRWAEFNAATFDWELDQLAEMLAK